MSSAVLVSPNFKKFFENSIFAQLIQLDTMAIGQKSLFDNYCMLGFNKKWLPCSLSLWLAVLTNYSSQCCCSAWSRQTRQQITVKKIKYSGIQRLVLQNTRNWGQRRKELWLCGNGRIKMGYSPCALFDQWKQGWKLSKTTGAQ